MKATQPQPRKPYTVPAGAPVHHTQTGEWAEAKRAQTIPAPHVTTYNTGLVAVRWMSGPHWRTVVIEGDTYLTRMPGERQT
jgi:hypothetical protein